MILLLLTNAFSYAYSLRHENGPALLTDNLGEISCSKSDSAIFRIHHEAFFLFASGYTALCQFHLHQTGQCIKPLSPAESESNNSNNDESGQDHYSTPPTCPIVPDLDCEILEEFYTPRHSDSSDMSEYLPSESSVDSESSFFSRIPI
jgi:hypothetical protein